jgi:rhamnosyltransferase
VVTRRLHRLLFVYTPPEGTSSSTVNYALRRSVWEKHPFGKMAIMEDKGFQRRVHLQGHEIVYSKGWVYHTYDYDFEQLRRRCQDEGYGWRLVGECYPLGVAIRDTFLSKNYLDLVRGLCPPDRTNM